MGQHVIQESGSGGLRIAGGRAFGCISDSHARKLAFVCQKRSHVLRRRIESSYIPRISKPPGGELVTIALSQVLESAMRMSDIPKHPLISAPSLFS